MEEVICTSHCQEVLFTLLKQQHEITMVTSMAVVLSECLCSPLSTCFPGSIWDQTTLKLLQSSSDLLTLKPFWLSSFSPSRADMKDLPIISGLMGPKQPSSEKTKASVECSRLAC